MSLGDYLRDGGYGAASREGSDMFFAGWAALGLASAGRNPQLFGDDYDTADEVGHGMENTCHTFSTSVRATAVRMKGSSRR